MSAHVQDSPQPSGQQDDFDDGPPNEQGTTVREPRSWRDGRSGLVLALVMVAYSTYLLYGILTMNVSDSADSPGPAFFPIVLMVAGYVLAVLLALAYWRKPEPVDVGEHRTYSDYRALGWCVGGFVIFALTLEIVGWVLAAAALFWCVARGIGSKRVVFDISVALLVSSAVYLIFGNVLGLNLPAGFLAEVF